MKTIVTLMLILLLALAGCGSVDNETVKVEGVVDYVYTHNTSVTIDGVTETWQYGTVIIMTDGTSYRILGAYSFEVGDKVKLELEPFEDNWYLLK
jgi:uncharacterized protein YceK